LGLKARKEWSFASDILRAIFGKFTFRRKPGRVGGKRGWQRKREKNLWGEETGACVVTKLRC